MLGITLSKRRLAVALAAILACAAVMFGLTAGHAGRASAAADDPSLTGKRVQCVDGHGYIRVLTAPCSQYAGMWFLGPVYTGGSAPAPTVTVTATPTAPLTLIAPSSSGHSASGTFTVEGNTTKSPGYQTVTIYGAEAYHAGAMTETFATNKASAPIGQVINVSLDSAPTEGSTERVYRVATSGFKAGESFQLTITVTDTP